MFGGDSMTDTVLLAAAITAAGLDPSSAPDRTTFARLIATSERTIRNWRGGATISAESRRWLERWVELDDRTRAIIVRALAA